MTRMLLVVVLLGSLAGCGGSNASTAGCATCGAVYTLEDCQAWGARAGCKSATTAEDGSGFCPAGTIGCSFKDCNGAPICDDTGDASCASCKGDYTQEDCDAFMAGAGCGTAATMDVTCNGSPSVGCDFTGCDFQPDC